jgi:hypothetical protein
MSIPQVNPQLHAVKTDSVLGCGRVLNIPIVTNANSVNPFQKTNVIIIRGRRTSKKSHIERKENTSITKMDKSI